MLARLKHEKSVQLYNLRDKHLDNESDAHIHAIS